MAHEIVMPQLGLSMDAGRIALWRKQQGESVAPGECLLEVESDKATIEVEAVGSGRLFIEPYAPDAEIPVGTVVGYLLSEEEFARRTGAGVTPQTASVPQTSAAPPEHEPKRAIVPAPDTPVPPADPSSGAGTAENETVRLRSSPAARRLARELGLDWKAVVGSGPLGRIKARDVQRRATEPRAVPAPAAGKRSAAGAAGAPDRAVRVSPVAARLIEALGVDVADLAAGVGPSPHIEREDVERYVRGRLARPDLQPRPAIPPAPPASRARVGSVRRTIAERMLASHQRTAPVTLTTSADATDFAAIRAAFRAAGGNAKAPGYSAMLAKVVAIALMENPALNSTLDGDEIVQHGAVHVAAAVDTERGLLAPVVRDVQAKSLRQLDAEYETLFERARSGRATPDDLRGSTFTITNLGAQEIDAFTPIINLPECAILGVGRLVEQVVARNGQPAIRTMVALSLTFDHRLVDGGAAARCLRRIKQLIEYPAVWLVE